MKQDFINNNLQREPITAATAVGLGITAAAQGGQIYAAGKMNRKTREWNEKMYGIQRRDALEDWKAQNQYNSPAEQMRRLKEAGLNPALMYGEGGAPGGVTAAARGSSPGSWNPEVPNMGMAIQGAQMSAQLELLKAQKENIEADTQEKLTRVPNIEADTDNKKLASIIADYTGRDLKDVYEKISVPNRDLQGRAATDNYSAQTAIGQTLNEMFVNGQLREKSNAEVEQILLSNSKTREETRNIIKSFDALEQHIKGQKLENAFKELDLKLQKDTGLGRDAPGWSKLFGRLLQLLMQQ